VYRNVPGSSQFRGNVAITGGLAGHPTASDASAVFQGVSGGGAILSQQQQFVGATLPQPSIGLGLSGPSLGAPLVSSQQQHLSASFVQNRPPFSSQLSTVHNLEGPQCTAHGQQVPFNENSHAAGRIIYENSQQQQGSQQHCSSSAESSLESEAQHMVAILQEKVRVLESQVRALLDENDEKDREVEGLRRALEEARKPTPSKDFAQV